MPPVRHSQLGASNNVAVGTVTAFGANTAPSGWLECNGSAVSRTTYTSLFSVIGTTYGVGDGSTTFNLPDLRGEFVRGWDNGRGVDGGRGIGTYQTSSRISRHVYKDTSNTGLYAQINDADTEVSWTAPENMHHALLTQAGNSGTSRELQVLRVRNISMMFCIKV